MGAVDRERKERHVEDEEWTRGLPKAETHCHLESLSEVTMTALAARRGVVMPTLEPGSGFDPLFPFLDACGALVATPKEAAAIAYGLSEREASSGVRHFEVIFNVAHWQKWWSGQLGAFVAALSDGFARGEADGLASGYLSVSFLRSVSADVAEALVAEVLDLRAPRVVALSVDGNETSAGLTGAVFARAFRRASHAGLRTVAHTGESGGAAHVADTLCHMAPDRIDHGFRVLEDPVLARRVAGLGVPLGLCPSQNVALGWCDSIETHPIETLRRLGARVSINTDSPWSFVLWEEYARCREAFDWSRRTAKTLARNSIEACFAAPAAKAALLAEVDAYAT